MRSAAPLAISQDWSTVDAQPVLDIFMATSCKDIASAPIGTFSALQLRHWHKSIKHPTFLFNLFTSSSVSPILDLFSNSEERLPELCDDIVCGVETRRHSAQ